MNKDGFHNAQEEIPKSDENPDQVEVTVDPNHLNPITVEG
jgi:hypothetical protein